MARENTTRITVTFSADATAWLEKEADKRATSVADLVRRVVDESRGAYLVQQRPGFTYRAAEVPET
jgi:hypothetical protein